MAGCQLPDRHKGRSETETARRGRAEGLILFFLAVCGITSVLAQPQRPPVGELVLKLQEKYARVRDFSASFAQTYSGGVLRTGAVERGTVLIKKPGKMRWTYTDPEEKLFVSDGVRLHMYIPAEKQVVVSDVPPENQASTPALFLAGRGSLTDDFAAAYEEVDGLASGLLAIRLTPVAPQPEYERLTLVIDGETLQIQQLTAVDYQGGISTFVFSNLKENQGLSDTLFAFRPPRGTEVITSDGSLR